MSLYRTSSAKVVAITGASSGVGRVVAHRFASTERRIGLIARDAGALDDVKQEVEQQGGSAMIAVADAEALLAAADMISAFAYQGIPLQSAYCAAKHAIRGAPLSRYHDSSY